ncbi:NAD-dependent epimerase/dehydratase family protein [Chondrinema litorale]|uniref:NAD-dependent epimerase/dehydratase family protein n=1 Tax=Chondrinema litorale TaxID=2994555 RepID=UPI00254362AA|nr:NAD-dependent epimerase/dehydratase family protein [Chondrinema litorale]UZR97029.1 NAD-dependent epimerase/dehydratase family protein [Chondrinema litorale]
MSKQTILGAGGVIGKEVAKSLTEFTEDIRLVSRNPQKVNPNDELLSADLTNADDVMKAVAGSEIVYLTVGFPYNYKVWKENWPKTMDNVIKACIENGCKLVYFDNIYMYDQDHLSPMDEQTPINPPSEKGKVRAWITDVLMSNINEGKINALIARSADFYGPAIGQNSVLTETVFNNFAKGKTANWLGNLNCKHSFTYTPDAGKATALLGNTDDAYGEVWHLPTASNPPTGKEWIDMIAAEFGVKPKVQVAGKFIVKIMGWFNPLMKELYEMLYQVDRDYVFNSSKFEKRFDFKPTPYKEGIKKVIAKDYS